tara:strand:- start:431 stop:601 length:171 start_codon:yes stop_codon:yes gene_type:complete
MVINIKRHHFFDAFDTYDGKFTFKFSFSFLGVFNFDLSGWAQSKSVLELLVLLLPF